MKKLLCSSITVLTVALFASIAFSQDNNDAAVNPPQEQVSAPVSETPVPVPMVPVPSVQTPIAEETPAIKEQSIYGEVQSMDAANGSMTVQYYDYDSDEEKSIDVVTDKDTKIENVAAISNIAKSDWVDVTYVIQNGKNVAKSVVVEKEEKEEVSATTAADATAPAMPSEQ